MIGRRHGDTVERHWCFLVPAGTTVTHTCMRLRVITSSIRTYTFNCWCTAFRGTAHACPPWLQSGSDRVSFAFASRLRVRVPTFSSPPIAPLSRSSFGYLSVARWSCFSPSLFPRLGQRHVVRVALPFVAASSAAVVYEHRC